MVAQEHNIDKVSVHKLSNRAIDMQS